MPSRKLFCYVDESGQDTAATPGRVKLFVVAVTVFEKDVADFETLCKAYELATDKRQKWNKSQRDVRLKYIRLVLEGQAFLHVSAASKQTKLRP